MFCIKILRTLSFLLAAKTQLPWQKSNSIRRQTPNIIEDLPYFSFIQAGQHLETQCELQIRQRWCIKTYSRAAQMSSPILSLKATWSNAIRIETFKSCCLEKKADKQHSKLADNTSGWPTIRPIPEETAVMATGSLRSTRLLCLSLSMSCVIPEERVCVNYTRRKWLC